MSVRVLVALVALLLIGGLASAGNPDGRVGTLWLDASMDASVNGKWKVGALEHFKSSEDTYKRSVVGGSLGFVASSRLTVEVGMSWYHNNEANLVYEVNQYEWVTDRADFTHDALMTKLRFRFYINK